MFGNVTALQGSHVTGRYRDEKHDAYMRQACGLGSSQAGILTPACPPQAWNARQAAEGMPETAWDAMSWDAMLQAAKVTAERGWQRERRARR